MFHLQLQIGNLIPNLGMSATSKVQATIPTIEVLRTFREHLLVVYSAHKPDTVIGYKNVDGESSFKYSKTFDFFFYAIFIPLVNLFQKVKRWK